MAQNPSPVRRVWKAALYTRLSREDGDKLESNSIASQKALLEAVVAGDPTLTLGQVYVDDGCTGTNFRRPGFQQMLADIEAGLVDCILVKDLSRFGRDYIDTGHYLERWLPAHGVRFIAAGDHIDSAKGAYDMLLPFKNVFNEQYARDISQKVRSSVRAKQEKGQFVGAFPSYGYRKSPADRNKLEIDPPAAQVVRQVFSLFEGGMGKLRIAKELNSQGIPCPSEYKRLQGERYHNGVRHGSTTYWTYSTIHRMLQNPMYTGAMAQGKTLRPGMHSRAHGVDRSQWVVVPHTHEAIISPQQWDRVQQLLKQTTRQPDFQRNLSPFAGFLQCGDCGRAMSKTTRAGGVCYVCGSYKRYGPSACSSHSISYALLEALLLEDLNALLAAVEDLPALIRSAAPAQETWDPTPQRERLQAALDRVYRLKKAAYEDHREGLLSKEDYLRYKADYENQEAHLRRQLDQLAAPRPSAPSPPPWIRSLLQEGRLTQLDRITLAETVQKIQVFADGRIHITYRFANDKALFPAGGPEVPPEGTPVLSPSSDFYSIFSSKP